MSIDHLSLMGVQRWMPRDVEPSVEESVIPREAAVASPSAWQTLEQTVAGCQQCGLCETRTQTVFGVGDRQADLLIVGEAPGYYEDQQGEPFVGRAGQLLNEMLKAIGLDREKVFIANVLKCRPPENRDPTPKEVATCTPYLEQQVQLLQPKVIVAVGRVAAHYLLDSKLPMARLRQQQYTFRATEIPLLVTYHPAYLLRNPNDKKKAYQDLLLIEKIIGKTNALITLQTRTSTSL